MRRKKRQQWHVSFVSVLIFAATFIFPARAAGPASLLEYESKPAFWESWSRFGPYFTEGNLVTTLNSISNLNLTAYYKPFCVIIDGGWAAPQRDAAGKLQFNLSLFPSGTNVLNLIHAYGCKAMLWTEVNGFGTDPTSGTPSTWGQYIEIDARTIAEWGFDGAKFDLTSEIDTPQQKIDQITRFVTAFRSVATNRQTYFYHDVGVGLDRDQFRSFPLGAVICENSENDAGDLLHWTDTMLTHLWNVNGKNQWSCGRETYESLPRGPSIIKMWSMFGSPYVFTSLHQAEYYWYREYYTKRECIALNNDSLYAAPELLFRTSTNVALTRKRSDGTLSAVALNTTTNQTQNLTFQFSQMGLPAGYGVYVRDIFNETNLGKFTNTFSFTLGPTESILVNLDSDGRKPAVSLARQQIGELLFNVTGRTNERVILQRSANFQSWLPIATNTMTTNPWSYTAPVGQWGDLQYMRAIPQ